MYDQERMTRINEVKIGEHTSPLLADELLLTDDVLCPTLGVLRGESVVPFTVPLDVPLVVTAFTGVPDELEFTLLLLPAVLVAPLASLNFSAN